MIIKERDRRTYIRKLIGVYEAIHPRSKDLKLRPHEIDFLVECIWLDINKIGIGSLAAREHIQDKLGLSDNSVYTLRSNLKTKGWLNQDKYGYHYPKGLDGAKFELNIKLNEPRRKDNRGGDPVHAGESEPS